MAININYSQLDALFPVEGQDQPSAGFRNNFDIIKKSLGRTEDELNRLEEMVLALAGETTLNWDSITNKPAFAAVATSGSYNDLLNKPENFSTSWDLITGKPVFATVATTGSYADLSNKPTIPTDLSQLTNTGSAFTSDDVPQGTTNLYLNQSNIAASLDQYSEIAGDRVSDSIETPAIPTSTTAQVATITLQSSNAVSRFFAGQRVKIFGANADQINITVTPRFNFATKNGFLGTPVTPAAFSYRIAQFDYATGKISPATAASTEVTGLDLSNFNTGNNVSINFDRTNANYGILIYRKITGSVITADFNLIAVLGPQDLIATTTSYVDYYDFDATAWSRKTLDRNDFDASSGLIHFPITAPNTAQRGWVFSTIQSINTTTAVVTLSSGFFFNASVIMSHDDTVIIQNAINSRAAQNLNSLQLGDKTYIISNVVIPSNFTIFGRSKRSTIKKLSWSAVTSTGTKNTIFNGSDLVTLDNDNIGLCNFKIDGNLQNQYLTSELLDQFTNYVVNIRGTGLRIEDLEMFNIIGGGIAADESIDFIMTNCVIQDSGVSDRYTTSPLLASNSDELTVNNNVFRNFAEGIDFSVSNIGMFSGNVVQNCGSGVITYGITKFVTSNNLILGPADEFIPGPDVYNSEYDSVNILLEPNANYLSDSYRYQENGDNFNLTANRAFVTYRIDKLRYVNNVEELYGQVLIPTANTVAASNTISTTATGLNGSASITVASSTGITRGMLVEGTGLQTRVYVLFVQGTNISLSKALTQTINTSAITFKANVQFSRAINLASAEPNGQTISGTGIPANTNIIAFSGTIAYIDKEIAVAGGVVTGADVFVGTSPIFSIVSSDFVNGEFRFNIPVNNVNELTSTFSFSTLKAIDTNHQGLVYRALLTEYVDAGSVSTVEILSSGIGTTFYLVTLVAPVFLSIGSRVRFRNHGGTPDLNTLIGTVTAVNSLTNQYTIQYNAAITVPGNTGSNVFICVENTFVLAKGRIL